ncbi:MAG: hypothetical protein JSS75_00525 [Bacteroidetes bacterium]|nr:hypothetical protein [Bacteroidota bacterium]
MKFTRSIRMIALALLVAGTAHAQRFVESPNDWVTKNVREHGLDTTRLEMHASFALDPINDTIGLIYHEPYPDSVMPKTAIEVAVITVQAEEADEVVETIEKEARKIGADWIIGFNEPRLHVIRYHGDARGIYRSTATLYRVINDELVPASDIAVIDCGPSHLNECKAVLTWLEDEHKSK